MQKLKSLSLRNITNDDLQWLVDLHNDPLVLRNVTDPNPIDMVDQKKWFTSINENPRQERMIFEIRGRPAGIAKFYDIDQTNHCCVLGADLHKDFRGKKLSKFMWNLMLDYCFNQLHMHRVSLTVAEYNVIAKHVYSSLGFKEEGRLCQSLYRDGHYFDQVCMVMFANVTSSI